MAAMYGHIGIAEYLVVKWKVAINPAAMVRPV